MTLPIESHPGERLRSQNPPPLRTTIQHSRNGHLNLDTFSPVNENGSFAFDRVLKSGKVLHRTKSKHAFKASWKSGYLVLRPNLLSLYKNEEEAVLQLSINLSEVTAVAHVKPHKSKRENIFGIYSPSTNYRFQATSGAEADSWVALVRNELSSEGLDGLLADEHPNVANSKEDAVESASELSDDNRGSRTSALLHARPRNLSHTLDYSGNDITSCSDFSDVPGPVTPQQSTGSLPKFDPRSSLSPSGPSDRRPSLGRNTSQHSNPGSTILDPERIVHQGYLLCLKSKKGVRQWKKLWAVLRPPSLSFYKDEREYSAVKILSMDQVINAAEIDPVSKSKKFCLQIIAEHKTYRFCAPSEEALAMWLGALKSVLVKKEEHARMSTIAGPLSPR